MKIEIIPANYSLQKLRIDLLAALTVTVIGLPQAMGYAIMAGVDPIYGLYASTLPVFVCAFLGSSRFLIGGATNTVSMLLYTVLLQVHIGGIFALSLPMEQRIHVIFAVSLIAGILQLLLGVAKLGRFATFLSHPVIMGYTVGCALLIAIGQLNNFLGLKTPPVSGSINIFISIFEHFTEIHLLSLGIALGSIALILVFNKIHKSLPSYFLAVLVMSVFAYLFDFRGHDVYMADFINSYFPPLSNPLPTAFTYFGELFMPALAIALISSVDSIANGRLFANKVNDPFDANKELIGQGIGKVVGAFSSSVPGSGSFSRTAINFAAKAQSRLAGMFTAVFNLVAIAVFGSYIGYIPIPALAAMLIMTSIGMIKKKDILFTWKTSKQDRIVFIATLFSVIILRLDQALIIGFLLSLGIFLNNESHLKIERIGLHQLHFHSSEWILESKEAILYNLEGAFFFGATASFENTFLKNMPRNPKIFILHMGAVNQIDSSGIRSLQLFMKALWDNKARLIISGANPSVKEIIDNSGIANGTEGCYLAGNVDGAIELAEYLLICAANLQDPDDYSTENDRCG